MRSFSSVNWEPNQPPFGSGTSVCQRRPVLLHQASFGWEPGVLLFPGYLKQVTIAYYVQALVPHAMPQDSAAGVLMQFFSDTPSIPASLTTLALIVVLALTWASRTVETRSTSSGIRSTIDPSSTALPDCATRCGWCRRRAVELPVPAARLVTTR